MTEISELHPAFQHSQYLFRKKVLKIFGGAFHIYDERGDLAFFGKQKAFKLREDMRIYADESQSEELLRIKTPQILDIGATYGVLDVTSDEYVGAIRRKGLKSIVRDEYVFIDADNQEIGKLTEKSLLSALASRFINLIPQKYNVLDNTGAPMASFNQHFNPFVLKYTLEFDHPESVIDRRLLLSAGILLAAIEGRQNN